MTGESYNKIDAKKKHVSATSLAPDWPVHKATPSDNTERTARSGAVVETIFLWRPRRAQCSLDLAKNYQHVTGNFSDIFLWDAFISNI